MRRSHGAGGLAGGGGEGWRHHWDQRGRGCIWLEVPGGPQGAGVLAAWSSREAGLGTGLGPRGTLLQLHRLEEGIRDPPAGWASKEGLSEGAYGGDSSSPRSARSAQGGPSPGNINAHVETLPPSGPCTEGLCSSPL